jgi:hypothetical protein
LHVNPQFVPSHVAVAFAGGTHAWHDAPHVLGDVLVAHAPAQRWLPALQVKPQLVPSHVAVAPMGGTHAVHEVPHELGEVLAAHALAQTW